MQMLYLAAIGFRANNSLAYLSKRGPDKRSIWTIQSFIVLGSAAVCLVAALVVAGYVLHIQTFINIGPNLQGMSIVTAFGLMSIAVSVLLRAAHRMRAARVAAWCGVIIGLSMLGLRAVLGCDVISPFIANKIFGLDPLNSGKTSIATAGCLAALGGAALSGERPFRSNVLSAMALLVSGFAMIGYAYGVRELYAIPMYGTMALHTAISMFALAVVSLMAKLDQGWASVIVSEEIGGRAARRQLAFTLMPVGAGWALIAAINAKRIDPAPALATLVILTVVPLVILILRDGHIMAALAFERRTKSEIQAAYFKDLEAALAQQALELKTAGAERDRAEAAMQHGQRMEAIGKFTGGIAHDFNNLLTAIGGNLQLLKRQLPGDHPARRYAENASVATDRGSKLTRHLLSFSRIHDTAIRSVEIDLALNDACALLTNALGSSIAIELRMGAPAKWAMTDPDQLEMAILNLAINAKDAMPAGGTLRIASTVIGDSTSALAGAPSFVSVMVSDSGLGMSQAIAARAAEPFFTTKEKGKGTGLGLAQVHTFVAQCKGEMRIRSLVGAGTTIELLFPLSLPTE